MPGYERRMFPMGKKPVDLDKVVTVCMWDQCHVGNWQVPIRDQIVITGTIRDMNKHFRLEAESARQVISLYNKKEKPRMEYAKECRQRGLDGGHYSQMFTYKKADWKDKKFDKEWERDGLKFQEVTGRNPF